MKREKPLENLALFEGVDPHPLPPLETGSFLTKGRTTRGSSRRRSGKREEGGDKGGSPSDEHEGAVDDR